MQTIAWQGAAPPSDIVAALRQAGVDIASSRAAEDDGLVVVHTATSRVPTVAARGKDWIWLCAVAVTHDQAIQAVLRGAYAVVSRREADAAIDLMARIGELLAPRTRVAAPPDIVKESVASKQVIAQIARVAPTSMPVLLTGETGTGKEVTARLIHAWSRPKHPFVPITCGAIPNELMEAELFGYARGAFSGAVQRYDGQLVAAEGGTVFLDEIDDTPLETQVKLLRVLEDRVVSRLGENAGHKVDFRLLAATNRDLRALIDAGLFGADLYERLAIVTIHLVPLRERLADLPSLARLFMQRFANEHRCPPVSEISTDALRALEAYPWPGNIRELRNVVYETLVYKRAGSKILLADLPKRILIHDRDADRETTVNRSAVARKIDRGVMNLREETAALTRVAIDEALKRSGGNAAQAARLLGQVGRGVARDPGGTLRAMMRRLTK